MANKVYPEILRENYSLLSRVVDGVGTPGVSYKLGHYSKNTTSDKSPNYPASIRENSFSSQELSWNKGPGYMSYVNYGKLTTTIDMVECITETAPSWVVAESYKHAVRRMYGEIEPVTANLALLYAERKATGESIALALGGILKAVRQVRKGKCPEIFMNANELAGRKKFSGAWLNYVYGIKPFCGDLYTIAHSDLKTIQRVRGKHSTWWQSKFYDPEMRGAGTYRVALNYGLSMKDPLTATLAGAGLTNPALIAWELTPFSFMADWLLPVGPYLEMLTSTSGFNKHDGSTTTTSLHSAVKVSKLSGAYHRINRFKVKRRTITTFPNVPLPSFKNPFSPVHALNALTIIHQFVKEPSKRRR